MRTSLFLFCVLLTFIAHAQPQGLKDYGLKGKVRVMKESTKDTTQLKKKEYAGYHIMVAGFDEAGNLISRIDTTVSLTQMRVVGLSTSSMQCKYNASNKLVEQVRTTRVYEDGQTEKYIPASTTHLYTYDKGKLSEITEINTGYHIAPDTSIVRLTYNNDKKLIARNWVKQGATKHADEKFTEIDAKSGIIPRHDPYTGKPQPGVDSSYTYDKKAETRTVKFTIGDGFNSNEYSLKYDSKDRLVEEIRSNSASVSDPVRTTYTMFDRQGNHTKSIFFQKRSLPATTLRQIEYYP